MENEMNVVENNIKKIKILIWIILILAGCNLFINVVNKIHSNNLKIPTNIAFEDVRQNDNDKVFEDFHAWPIQRQVMESNVIIRTKYENRNGNTKCIIDEIIKKSDSTKFYYNIGDIYPDLEFFYQKGSSNGDGQIAFFVGTPASMRYAVTYANSRLGSGTGITLDELRNLAKTTK